MKNSLHVLGHVRPRELEFEAPTGKDDFRLSVRINLPVLNYQNLGTMMPINFRKNFIGSAACGTSIAFVH